jgi:hypothetical protein
MSRRRHRVDQSPSDSSDHDDALRPSASASSHGRHSNSRPVPHPRSRLRDALNVLNDPHHREEFLQWRILRENPFGAGIAPFLALLGLPSGPGAAGPLPPGLLERMQLARHEMSGVEKQKLIDSTTIVCMHNGVDEVQCGICLQSLEQGAQLRMAQYVACRHMLSATNFLTLFSCAATNFTTIALLSGSRCTSPPCLPRTSHTLRCSRISTAPSAA